MAGQFSDRYGRIKTMFSAALLFLIGGLIILVSWNFTTMIIGRLITGVGVGIGLAVDPLYISEISPKSKRGSLVTLSEFAINIGILLGFISNFVFSYFDDSFS